MVDDLDDVFVPESFWDEDCGLSFTANDRSVIAIALPLLPNTAEFRGPILPTFKYV